MQQLETSEVLFVPVSKYSMLDSVLQHYFMRVNTRHSKHICCGLLLCFNSCFPPKVFCEAVISICVIISHFVVQQHVVVCEASEKDSKLLIFWVADFFLSWYYLLCNCMFHRRPQGTKLHTDPRNCVLLYDQIKSQTKHCWYMMWSGNIQSVLTNPNCDSNNEFTLFYTAVLLKCFYFKSFPSVRAVV